MRSDAFLTRHDENKLYDVVFYHTPQRWDTIDRSELPISMLEWSEEIKFLDNNGMDLSEGIKSLPEDCGGIYVFFIKGVILPYFENYLAYVGRAQFTSSHNLRERCRKYYYEYFKEDARPKIARMIERWGNYLYLRYYKSTNNPFIESIEKKVIRGILPPFNDEIPDLEIKAPEPAF